MLTDSHFSSAPGVGQQWSKSDGQERYQQRQQPQNSSH